MTSNESLDNNNNNNEFDFDDVGSDAYRAADSGLSSESCRFAPGSPAHDYWTHEFWNRKCQPYISLGERAAREGAPITATPADIAPCLQDAWKMGWMVANDGPFGGLKGIEFLARSPQPK